jgi:hypothetical protein
MDGDSVGGGGGTSAAVSAFDDEPPPSESKKLMDGDSVGGGGGTSTVSAGFVKLSRKEIEVGAGAAAAGVGSTFFAGSAVRLERKLIAGGAFGAGCIEGAGAGASVGAAFSFENDQELAAVGSALVSAATTGGACGACTATAGSDMLIRREAVTGAVSATRLSKKLRGGVGVTAAVGACADSACSTFFVGSAPRVLRNEIEGEGEDCAGDVDAGTGAALDSESRKLVEGLFFAGAFFTGKPRPRESKTLMDGDPVGGGGGTSAAVSAFDDEPPPSECKKLMDGDSVGGGGGTSTVSAGVGSFLFLEANESKKLILGDADLGEADAGEADAGEADAGTVFAFTGSAVRLFKKLSESGGVDDCGELDAGAGSTFLEDSESRKLIDGGVVDFGGGGTSPAAASSGFSGSGDFFGDFFGDFVFEKDHDVFAAAGAAGATAGATAGTEGAGAAAVVVACAGSSLFSPILSRKLIAGDGDSVPVPPAGSSLDVGSSCTRSPVSSEGIRLVKKSICKAGDSDGDTAAVFVAGAGAGVTVSSFSADFVRLSRKLIAGDGARAAAWPGLGGFAGDPVDFGAETVGESVSKKLIDGLLPSLDTPEAFGVS